MEKRKLIEGRAVILLKNLLETFPALDPESKFYDQPVSGVDAVQWLSENALKNEKDHKRMESEKKGVTLEAHRSAIIKRVPGYY